MHDGAVPSGEDDLETYAIIASELARGADRAALLAEHGLDEAGLEKLEERANAQMSGGDDDASAGVPEPIARFDTVLRRAAATSAADVPSLEDFVRAFLIAQEGGKVHERLKERGLSIALLLRGSAYYTPRLATDAQLARQFQALCSRSGKPDKAR